MEEMQSIDYIKQAFELKESKLYKPATKPYQVIHTDITQIWLANQQWAYVSAMVDEASKEVLAFQVSHHPNLQLVKSTIDELLQKLPDNAHPIIHSDQG